MAAEVEIGTVRATSVKVNRDGSDTVRMLDVELTGPTDVQSCQLVAPIGADSVPLDGDKVLVVRAGQAFPLAIPYQDGVIPDAAAGGVTLYSRKADGSRSAVVTMTAAGEIQLNGASDWAVAYTDLKSAFDQFVSDFNSHMHAYIAPGPTPGLTSSPASAAGPPVVPAPTTADMADSKVSSVRVP